MKTAFDPAQIRKAAAFTEKLGALLRDFNASLSVFEDVHGRDDALISADDATIAFNLDGTFYGIKQGDRTRDQPDVMMMPL